MPSVKEKNIYTYKMIGLALTYLFFGVKSALLSAVAGD